MFKIICVANRKLCNEDFLTRIEKIAAAKPDRILLREKDLSCEEYKNLAVRVTEICEKYGVTCSLYNYYEDFGEFHFPLPVLRETSAEALSKMAFKGTSVHSVEEAAEAEKLGVDYMIAGHIFETSCKPDLAPRGLGFLRSVCESVEIPVYAIGGISAENIGQIVQAGADGACIMSGFMTCDDPAEYINKLRKGAEKDEF